MELSENEVTDKVIGCAIEVHRQLGPGVVGKRLRRMFMQRVELEGDSFREASANAD